MTKDINIKTSNSVISKLSTTDHKLFDLYRNLENDDANALMLLCTYLVENRDTRAWTDEDALDLLKLSGEINRDESLAWIPELACLFFRYQIKKETSQNEQDLILETNIKLTELVYQIIAGQYEPEERDIRNLKDIAFTADKKLLFVLEYFHSFLDEISKGENGGVSKFVLAFLDFDNHWDWLLKSSEAGFVLSTYRYAHSHTGLDSDKNDANAYQTSAKELKKMRVSLNINKYQLTVQTILTLYNIILIDMDFSLKKAHSLSMESQHLRNEKILLETKRESERKMLSFLTHTLRNSLASGPQELKQVIGFIGTEEYENNNKKYSAINTLVSQLSTFAHLDTLISTFKQIVGDKESFHRQWKNDTKGASNVGDVIKMCLRQLISRALFFPNYQRVIQRLMGDKDLNKLKFARKDYLQNVLSSEISEIEALDITGWAESFLPKLEISISDDSLNFGTHETKYIFLFSIFSELIWNAFKYADNENAISIEWSKAEDVYQFKVVNHCRGNQNSMALSTNKGLDFIQHLLQLHQGTSLKFGKDEHLKYIAEISFPIEIFK
jgi:hypothetical protein